MSSGDHHTVLAARLAEALAERDEAIAERDAARRERDEALARASRQEVRRRLASGDTRPLITDVWAAANPAEWERLCASCPAECPVCFESRPRNSMDAAFCHETMSTRCTHWACLACWQQIGRRDRRCPICHDDLTAWLPLRQ